MDITDPSAASSCATSARAAYPHAVSSRVVFTGTGDALAAVLAGLRFLANANAAELPIAELSGCLQALEQAESVHTAARTRLLASFDARGGHELDGHRSPRPWLIWRTRITLGAAAGAMGWMRRLAAHPSVADALADGQLSASWARQVCAWSDALSADRRADADAILLRAAARGLDLEDLAGLAEEMFRRCAPPDSDDGKTFEDRGVQLDLHFRGAGRLTGDLTPECAAGLAAVLESLGKKAGSEDDRTQPQRNHDALEEACRRLTASGTLPDRAGQPTQVQLHLTLDQLRSLPGARSAEQAWAAGRATADGQPGWSRDRTSAEAYACDAAIAPLVSGHLDPDPSAGPGTAGDRLLRDTLVRYAADVLSGPAGLAAFLRSELLGGEFPAVSLPLDVGRPTDQIPPHLRRAVISRDRHRAFPGCRVKPAGCQVHHVLPKSRGGPTRLDNLLLVCSFHHLIAVHRWGWTVTLHGDGEVTALSPDGTTTLHSHGRPTAAA